MTSSPSTAGAAGAGKLPRIDLRKLTGGDVAARREAVAVLGDALREHGGVRVEGHGLDPGDPRELAVVADHLLEALADYFGLPARAFVDAAVAPGTTAGGVALAGALPTALLAILGEPTANVEVRSGAGGWTRAGARATELVVLPGGALAALTAGVVPPAAARWRDGDATRATLIGAAHPAELLPLREFAP